MEDSELLWLCLFPANGGTVHSELDDRAFSTRMTNRWKTLWYRVSSGSCNMCIPSILASSSLYFLAISRLDLVTRPIFFHLFYTHSSFYFAHPEIEAHVYDVIVPSVIFSLGVFVWQWFLISNALLLTTSWFVSNIPPSPVVMFFVA